MDSSSQIEIFHEFIDSKLKAELLESSRKTDGSLKIDFSDLSKFNVDLCEDLLITPEDVIKAAELALEKFDVQKKVRVRFFNLPESSTVPISNIRARHLSKFIKIVGVIRTKTPVRPQVVGAKFECPSCGNIININQDDNTFQRPTSCSCGRKGKFKLIDQTLIDAQKLTLEEAHEDLESGTQPKRLDILLKEDLASPWTDKRSNPGSKVVVTGYLKEVPIITRQGSQSITFNLILMANHIEPVEEDFTEITIDDKEIGEILSLSKDPFIFEKLNKSIAPSIYGHDKIKDALVLQLFGGVRKVRDDGVITRGDTHILLVGDPGTSKSQMIKRLAIVAPKSRYVSGKGVSGAGLCVAPDSLVLGNPGGLRKIETIVEEKLKNNQIQHCEGVWKAKENGETKKIYTVSDKLKMSSHEIEDFWKLKSPEKMISIKTRLGKDITLTQNTKLLTLNQGFTQWKCASEISRGEYIATPRTIPDTEKHEIELISLIKSDPKIHNIKNTVKSLLDLNKVNKRELAKDLEINENSLYRSWINNDVRGKISLQTFKKLTNKLGVDFLECFEDKITFSLWNGKPIQIPKYASKDFMYFLGIIAGDGDLSKGKNSTSIRFSSASEKLMAEFLRITEELFRVKCVVKINANNSAKYARFASKIVAELCHAFGVPLSPKSHRIDPSDLLLHADNNLISSFISGLFDCDGSVIKRTTKGSSYIDFTTTSEALAKKLLILLLRFEIIGKLRIREPSSATTKYGRKIIGRHHKFIIEIRGKNNLENFRDKIGFKGEKKEKLRTIIPQKSNTNIDIIPTAHHLIKNLKDETSSTSKELNGYKTSAITSGRYKFSRGHLKKILSRLKSTSQNSAAAQQIEMLAESDVFWDEISEINLIDSPYKYVYDFTVKNAHSFVVNGIIVHNTASVIKDEFTGSWALEAGAIVLANKGFCFIDEMDKMNKEDRDAMHECLEQQTISISKANIQATLRCETTVLAAANPKFGRFDPYLTVSEQIDMPASLISRFDLIFPVKDLPNKERDEKMSLFILKLHQNKPENKVVPPIQTELLRKYIAFARQNCKPILIDEAVLAIQKYYVETRSMGYDAANKAVAISTRQLEGIVRMAEASARARLSKEVTVDDAKRAIELVQHCLSEIAFDKETGRIDIDKIASGISSSERGKLMGIREIITALEQKIGRIIPVDDIMKMAEEKGIPPEKVEEAIEKLKRSGDIFEPRAGFISKL